MKVLLLIDSLVAGGAQRQLVGLAVLLRNYGYQVKLIYYHPLTFYKTYLDEQGVDNEFVLGSSNKWVRIWAIANYIKKDNPDVIISYMKSPSIITCLLKAFGMKFKLIVSERNTTQKLTISEKIHFTLMRWADAIVPNSYSQEKYIANNFPHLFYKVSTITNFVDTDYFIPGDGDNFNLSCETTVLCVARVHDQKNILNFMDAVFRLKEQGHHIKIRWFGYKTEPYYSNCIKKQKELGLDNCFTFMEPTVNIQQEYQKADVFCLPSFYEGYPNVICEAMSCGLPILCSNVCDNPIIVKNEINGYLFDPNDVNDIVCTFDTFLKLPNISKYNMRIRNRKDAIRMFSKETFVAKYVNIISSIYGNSK